MNAATGFPLITGPEEHAGPVNHVLLAWDVACGLYAALGLLAAERHRRRTGEGRAITLALEDVALAVAGHLGFLAEAQLGMDRPRIGNYLYGGFARDFATADGARIMLVPLTARHFADLAEVTGLAGTFAELERLLGADFSTDGDRYAHREVIASLLAPWFGQRTLADVASAFAGSSVLWERYRSFTELTADPGFAANPLLREIDQPGVGSVLAPGSPLAQPGVGAVQPARRWAPTRWRCSPRCSACRPKPRLAPRPPGDPPEHRDNRSCPAPPAAGPPPPLHVYSGCGAAVGAPRGRPGWRGGRFEQPDPAAPRRPGPQPSFLSRRTGPGGLPGVRPSRGSGAGVLPRPGIARGLRPRGRPSRALDDDLAAGTRCSRRARPAGCGRSPDPPTTHSGTLGTDRNVDRGPGRHPDRPRRSSRRSSAPPRHAVPVTTLTMNRMR